MSDVVLFADDGGSGWGTVVAAVILALLPIAFAAPLLYAVFNKSAAKGYSRRAVQSVGVWLIALSVLLGAVIMAVFGHYTPGDVTAYRIAAAVFGLAAWSVAVVGLAFAARGLRETDRKRKRRRRGHNFAVGGTTGNVLVLLGLLVGGGWYGRHLLKNVDASASSTGREAALIFAEATRLATEALENAPAVPPDALNVGPTTASGTNAAPPPTLVGAGNAADKQTWFGTLFGGLPSDASQDRGPTTLDVAALNLQLRRPGEGWFRIDPARAGENAAVAYDAPQQKLRFIAAAARPGVEQTPNPTTAAESTQQRLRAVVPSFTFDAGRQLTVGGVEGIAFAGNGRNDAEDCAAQGWIGVHNGFVYELLVVGSGKPAETFADEATRLFQLFAPLDAALVAHASQAALPAETMKSTALGLEVKSLSAPWTAIADLATKYPAADFGARYDAQTGFITAGVRVDDAVPDGPAATYALLKLAGQPYERIISKSPTRVTQSGLTGEEYVWSTSGEGAGYHTARVFVGRRTAYLVLGWCDAEGSPRYDVMKSALSNVQFTNVGATPPGDLPPQVRERSARFHDLVGRYEMGDGDAAAAERHFRSALKFEPDAATYLADIVDACFARQRPDHALAALEERPQFTQQHDVLRLRLAEAQAAVGRRGEAIDTYAALFADGYLNDDAVLEYVGLLEQSARWDDALALVKAYRRRRDSAMLYALEARLLSRRGDNVAAVAMLERRVGQAPTESEPALALAELHRRLQRPDEALKVIDRLIANGNRSADAYYWRGLAEYDLRRTRAARDAFEQAHRLAPVDVSAKQMLDHVTRLLGEAENLRIRAPLEPVALPAAVVDAVPSIPMPDEFGRAAAYYLDRVTAYRFVAGQDYRRTEYHTVRVLTAQGVDELNTLSVRFDPLSEEVFVNRLDVYDDTGRPIAGGDVATYYLIDEDGGGAHGGERVLMLPVPGLRPGYRIELVATVRGFVNRTQFPYIQTYFGLQYPVRRQAVVVVTDPNTIAWSGTQSGAVRRELNAVWWQAVDLPAVRNEPFAPDRAETEPSLFVADKQNTWQSETKRYIDEIEELREVPEIVVKTAQEKTAGLESSEAKLLALAAFVQNEIAYQPAPFGTYGRAPQPADKTLANRFGDGQDVSLLLAQMLAAVRVDTLLALVNTEQPVQGKLPTLDQFNHMVVFIPEGDSGRVIDATDKEADARLPVPLRLAGREALIIDHLKPRLVRLPRVGADAYRADVQRQVRFNDRGTALVHESVTYYDYYAAAMRGGLRAVAPADRADFWQATLREAGTPVVLRSFDVAQLDDLTAPLVVTADYEVERALASLGVDDARQWVGTIPAAFESSVLSAPVVEQRKQPLDFQYALRLTSTVEVEAPAGLANAATADLVGRTDSDLLTAERSGRSDTGVVRLAFELKRPAGRHPPTRYDDYRNAVQDARATAAPVVRFIKPPGT